tara:strand:- start:100080 stop:101591 length:1512 start_codon:yes stop_codon:yes gene_type:complete
VSELPKGWVKTKIGDVTTVVAGGTPKAGDKSNFAEPGKGIAWLTPADLSKYGKKSISHGSRDLSPQGLKSSSAKLMPKGTILFSSRAPIGYTVIAENEIATNQGFKNFVLPKGLNSSYTYYYLKSIKHIAESMGTGTTFKELSGAVAKTLPFVLAPKNEQIRIADKLDSMLAKVDAAQARLDKIPNILKRFRQSVLAAATSGELTKEWRISNSQSAYDFELLRQNIYDNWLEARHAEFKRKGKTPKSTTWLKKFPEPNFVDSMIPTWISLSLENIAEVVDPNPSHRMPSYVVEGKAFISSENIININKLNFSKGKKVTAEEVEKQKTRYEIVEGTFAFTRIGTIGKSVLLPKPHDYGISHAMAVVNPYKLIMDSAFLILTMNCETILKQASHGVQSVGVPDLGIGKMKNFTVPLPPLMEQQEIVRRVESLFTMADTVEKQYKDAKARTNRLTQSILAKAFRGELVPQDSNDEPASELLAGIKANLDNVAAKSKVKRKTKSSII